MFPLRFCLISLPFTAHSGPVTCVAASPHQDSVFLSCSEVRCSFFPSRPLTTLKLAGPESSVETSKLATTSLDSEALFLFLCF